MRKIGNSDMNIIIEGLNEDRYNYDDYDDLDTVDIEDTLVILKRGRLEDAISVGLEKKYGNSFEKFGDFSVLVDIGLTDDEDYRLDDIADEVVIGVMFGNELLNYIEVVKELKKKIKSFKGFDIKYNKHLEEYNIVVDTQEDILDLFDALSKDGCNIKNFYKVIKGEEIKDNIRKARADNRTDREYLDREYRRNAL